MLAAIVIGSPPAVGALRRFMRATACGSLLVAVMIQGGAIHVVPPGLLFVAILVMMNAMRGGPVAPAAMRMALAVAAGCALCAGKLAASIAFIGNFPRAQYKLPGILGMEATIWRAFQTLFIGPPGSSPTAAVNSNWMLERHEWTYGVTVVPLLLMLAWAASGPAAASRLKSSHCMTLVVLLAIPVGLNWYQADWNAVLKSLPVIGSSSNLLRWFAAYILPAYIAAALALQAPAQGPWRPKLAFGGLACAVGIHAQTDLGFYGPDGQGTYRVETIEAAWQQAALTRAAPAVTMIAVLKDQQGKLAMPPGRQDGLTLGYSQLLCYEPVFGYNSENFPIGTLHPGSVFLERNKTLNLKNLACYIFPGANACAAGDQFPASRLSDAHAVADYRPFAFSKPVWAEYADWLGILASGATVSIVLTELARLRGNTTRATRRIATAASV